MDDQNIVDFGYKSVKKSDKQKLVNNVFNTVAHKYDLMNDITSLGIHRNWKSDLINWIAPQSNQNLADIAGGTGDIAYRFLNAGGNSAHIFDINKISTANISKHTQFSLRISSVFCFISSLLYL